MQAYSVSLDKFIKELNLEAIYLPRDAEDIFISTPEVNRPALLLAGYTEYFDSRRVQICGKVKGHIMIPADLTKEQAEKDLPANPDIQKLLGGKTVVKVIYVPGRLLNIVAK